MDPSLRLPTTKWGEITAANQTNSELRRDALDSLLSRYLVPLKNHLICKFGVDESQAEEWLQAFCLEKVLQKRILGTAHPQRGRFRSFLLNSLDNFVLTQLRDGRARKRHPDQPLVPLHATDEIECTAQSTCPASDFDLDWARQVTQNALEEMQFQCQQSGQKEIWGVFEGRLLRDLFDHAPPLSYEEIVRLYGFSSPEQAMNALNSAKRIFNRILRAEVSKYLHKDQAIEEELRELKDILLRSKGPLKHGNSQI